MVWDCVVLILLELLGIDPPRRNSMDAFNVVGVNAVLLQVLGTLDEKEMEGETSCDQEKTAIGGGKRRLEGKFSFPVVLLPSTRGWQMTCSTTKTIRWTRSIFWKPTKMDWITAATGSRRDRRGRRWLCACCRRCSCFRCGQ